MKWMFSWNGFRWAKKKNQELCTKEKVVNVAENSGRQSDGVSV